MTSHVRAVLSAALLALAATPSYAQPFLRGSYAGADVVYTHIDYGTVNLGAGPVGAGTVFANDLWSGDVHVGMRFSDMFAIEAGYLWIPHSGKTISPLGDQSTVRIQGATVDGLVYLPLDSTRGVEAVGLLGVSWLEALAHLSGPLFGSVYDKKSEWGWRVGGGAQVWLNQQVSVRGLLVYQSADLNGEVDSALSTRLGVNIQLQ
jgi:hypothetical protein